MRKRDGAEEKFGFEFEEESDSDVDSDFEEELQDPPSESKTFLNIPTQLIEIHETCHSGTIYFIN